MNRDEIRKSLEVSNEQQFKELVTLSCINTYLIEEVLTLKPNLPVNHPILTTKD